MFRKKEKKQAQIIFENTGSLNIVVYIESAGTCFLRVKEHVLVLLPLFFDLVESVSNLF